MAIGIALWVELFLEEISGSGSLLINLIRVVLVIVMAFFAIAPPSLSLALPIVMARPIAPRGLLGTTLFALFWPLSWFLLGGLILLGIPLAIGYVIIAFLSLG